MVFIYTFRGQYIGGEEYSYTPPELNATHKCMLFVAQESDSLEFEKVVEECGKYGFSAIENLRGNRLQIDSLHTDTHRGFAGFYEEALESGSSLVFYPNDK